MGTWLPIDEWFRRYERSAEQSQWRTGDPYQAMARYSPFPKESTDAPPLVPAPRPGSGAQRKRRRPPVR